MGIGSRMRKARQEARLSGVAVAKLCQVTHSAVYQWERGITRPSLASFARWLDAVGIPEADRGSWWRYVQTST